MSRDEILRTLKGLIKKHDTSFAVRLRYMTATGKVKKRHGEFVALHDDQELVLFNSDKVTEGRYQLDRIVEIKKQ